MTHFSLIRHVGTALIAGAIPIGAHAATPADLQAAYGALSGTTVAPDRGQQLFTSRHGGDVPNVVERGRMTAPHS